MTVAKPSQRANPRPAGGRTFRSGGRNENKDLAPGCASRLARDGRPCTGAARAAGPRAAGGRPGPGPDAGGSGGLDQGGARRAPTPGAIALVPEGAPPFGPNQLRLPRETVTRFELVTGKKRQWLPGLVVGAVLGVAMGFAMDVDPVRCEFDDNYACSRGEAVAVMGGVLGGDGGRNRGPGEEGRLDPRGARRPRAAPGSGRPGGPRAPRASRRRIPGPVGSLLRKEGRHGHQTSG